MRPVLFSWGPLTIQTMGLFYVLAFFVAAYVFWKKGSEEHYLEDELFDGFLLAIIVGIFWSRVGFILFHFQHFGLNPLKWVDVFASPGMLPMVGMLVAGGYLFRYAKKQKWDAFEILDFSVLAASCALVVLYIGSFLAGMGFGNPTTLPIGMNFPGVFDKRHPVQIYNAAFFAMVFWYLSWVEPRYRTFTWYRDKRHSAQSGFLTCIFCIAYGAFGVVTSLLSPPQLVAGRVALDLPVKILILLFGMVLLYTRTGRSLPFLKR